jgi:hypothetical protein
VKLTQKYTCGTRWWHPCVALKFSRTGPECLLGYQCEERPERFGHSKEVVPLEPCPKPTTPKEFAKCKKKDGGVTPTTEQEERLECSECDWRGTEAQSTRVDFHDEPNGWACPQCSAPCAHVPIDELEEA